MSRTPLVDAWRRAKAAKRRPMQVPGHKMRYADDAPGWAADLVGDTVSGDIPLQGGVDDNAYSNRYLEQAEELWAQAVGADHSRFLVGGSSQGNIAALATVGDEGVPIAIDRTSHRSTQAGLVLIGARPVWIYPRLHPEFHLPIGMEAASLTDVADRVNGFFATSPSYIGTISDVASLAAAAHARNEPLIIDQAWGAHLDFLPEGGAMRQGADFSVTSVHKALMGYSQTAVVSMRGDLIPHSTLDRWVDLTTTTSPSGTLMATIDGTRAAMERDGAARLALLMEAVAEARATAGTRPRPRRPRRRHGRLPRRPDEAHGDPPGHRCRRLRARRRALPARPRPRVGGPRHAGADGDRGGRAGVGARVRRPARGPDRGATAARRGRRRRSPSGGSSPMWC